MFSSTKVRFIGMLSIKALNSEFTSKNGGSRARLLLIALRQAAVELLLADLPQLRLEFSTKRIGIEK
jgi:hypothetical protein